MAEILLGSHVGMSGKEMFLGSVKEAAEYGANALMVYTGAPQNTRRKEIGELRLDEGLAYAEKAGIREIIIHAPYIINLGNMEKPEMFDFGVEFLGESMPEQLKEKLEEKGMKCCHCHQKATPRSETERKQLQNRLSRMTGQLNGISRMLEENRYCGDILTQVAAVESALQAFGYAILKEHMETCVVEEIRKGNTAIVEEAVDLVKKLK